MAHRAIRLWSTLAVLAAALVGCGQPTKYEAASFQGDAIRKQAGSYWKRDGWWGGIPKDVTKVAITQFSVEYVTENVDQSGASALSVLGAMEMVGVGHRKREFTSDFKQQLPTPLYEGFVAALKSSGIEVIPMADLARNPAFADLKTGQAGDSYSQGSHSTFGGSSTSAKIQIYPVRGLPLVDDGWFNGANNAKAEARIIAESGAQGGLRVRIRVALDDDGHAVLSGGSTIRVIYQPEQTTVGFNKETAFYMKGAGAVVSHAAMRDDVPVITGKEFKAFQGDVYTIDGPKFQESILKMYPAYSQMAVIMLKS